MAKAIPSQVHFFFLAILKIPFAKYFGTTCHLHVQVVKRLALTLRKMDVFTKNEKDLAFIFFKKNGHF